MRLEPLGTLFAASWKRFTGHFSTAWKVFLVPAALMLLGGLLIAKGTVGSGLVGGIFDALGGVASFLGGFALIAVFGKGTDFGGSYRASFTLFWSAIWATILTVLAVVGGLALLIVPGVILSVQLGFVSYALVLSGRRGLSALALSREYLKGYWWAFLGRKLLLALVYFAAVLLVYLPIVLLFGKFGGAVFYPALLLFFAPFAVAYEYEIFENLRRLKPDAEAKSAEMRSGFLKTTVVLGILAIVALIVFAGVAIVLFGIGVFNRMNSGGQYGGPIDWSQVVSTSTQQYLPNSNAGSIYH